MAATTTINEITEELLVCQICLEDYKQPKMLPCLHTFCQPCLERMLVSNREGKLFCPTCRQDVPLSENGVQGLRGNFLIGKLHDILQQQQRRESQADISEQRETVAPCTACEAGNPAQVYCVQCTDYLCQTCNDAHSQLRATRSHKVITVDEVKKGMLNSELRARETSQCKAHNELNKFYCETCDQIICLHCVVTTHKDHNYVEIEKAAEVERAKIRGKLLTVKNAVGLHEKWIEKLRSVRDQWSSQVQRTEEQIERQAKTITEAVLKVKSGRIGQLRSMTAAQQKQLGLTIEAAEMDLASAKSCIRFADNMLEYGSPAEFMSVVEELTGRLEKSADQKTMDDVKMAKDLGNLTFDPPAVDVEQEVARLMGIIKQPTTPKPSVVLQVRPNVALVPDNYGGRVKSLRNYVKKIKNEGRFLLPTSLAVTIGGDIVVTDHGSKRLMFLDREGNFKNKVDLRFKPWCVAILTNGDMLVTGDGHRIHVLYKQGRESRIMQVPGALDKGATTRGIAADGLGHIITTIGRQVFLLSRNGELLMRFGEQQLSSNLRVTVNTANQIIVSDLDNHNLKIFDPAGRYLTTSGSHDAGHGQLHGPYCIITDSEDNIIVADSSKHRVALFSRDGTFVGHLLTKEHGVSFPMGLTLTHDGHLVVSGDTSVKFFPVN